VTGLSVVIASRDEGDYLARSVESLCRSLRPDDEVVVVDDASGDGSADGLDRVDPRVRVRRCDQRIGVARARNLGARLSRGDVLLFADAHIEVAGQWRDELLAPLVRRNVAAVAPSLFELEHRDARGYGLRLSDVATNLEWLPPPQGRDPYPVPLLPGFFVATRRSTFVTVGGFDPGLVGYGMDDVEFSLRLWSLGWSCVLVPAVEVGHLSKWFCPPVHHGEWDTTLHNILRVGVVHYGADRLRALFGYYAYHGAFGSIRAAVLRSDAVARRRRMRAVRARDDDWFFAFCDERAERFAA
jgi:GT2 family glycosyltransferase